MSNWLIRILILEYIIIMMVCVWERNFARSLYWLGAVILQLGILLGMK
jgi:hypothetical protein